MAKKRKRATKPKSQKSGNTTIVVSPAQQSKQSKGVRITKLLWRILYITVLCCLVVGLVSWGLQKIGTLFNWWNVETVTVDASEDGFATNTNGGLTYDQIQQQLSDPDAPYCDDVFSQFQIIDYPGYVVFYRVVDVGGGSYIYPNIIMAKTENGLIWDGVVGVKASISTNWWTGEHYWDTLSFDLQLENYATAQYMANPSLWYFFNIPGISVQHRTNQVLISNFDWSICTGFDSFNVITKIWYNMANESNTLLNYTRAYLVENVVSQYFSNWGNGVELLGGDAESASYTDLDYFAKFNSYYTFLYNQLKTEDHTNNSKLVDSTDYYARFITDYENYPIPTSKLSEYNGETYYKVYKCQIIADCTYTYLDTNATSFAPKVEKLDDYEIEEPAVVAEQAKLTVKLVNADESNLTGLSLADYPVTIVIDGRKFVYDDTTDLTNGKVIALDKGDTYTYSIISEALEFSSYSGSVNVLNTSQIMELDYTYSGLYIEAELSLNLLNSMPEDFSLATYPVTITLTGTDNEGTYTTTWNSNANLLTTNTVTMKRGTYVWTVSSEYILFNNTSGQITIDNTNKYHTFSCYFPEELVGSLSLTFNSAYADNYPLVIDVTDGFNTYFADYVDMTGENLVLSTKIFVDEGGQQVLIKSSDYYIPKIGITFITPDFTNVDNYTHYYIQAIITDTSNNSVIISPILLVNNTVNISEHIKLDYSSE